MTTPTTTPAPAIDNKVKQIVSNIRNLPTPPIVFHQIQKVLNDPLASANQVAAILSEDPAMSVKVLKLTNSAFYGLQREVESVKQAVVVVGMEAIKNLVLSASVLDMFKGEEYDQEFQEQFWRHSLATAFCGRIVARKLKTRGMVDPDSAFSAGLLHDIGKIIMATHLQEDYAGVISARAEGSDKLDHDLEESILGYHHAQIGAILAEQWKLPSKLQESIAFHHHPQLAEGGEATPYIVHIADFVSKKTFYEADDQARIGTLQPGVEEYMQLDEAMIESYCEALREEYSKAETFMKMAGLS
ncbi:MAG: HDOD domain-containing protein [candidate division Zixibacteria bacterium]